MSRDLVFCMTHLRNPYDGKLLRVWQEMLEPQGCDLLIVESKSPHALSPYLQGEWDDREIPDADGWHMRVVTPRTVLRFEDALGHPFHDGVTHGSGSDRAMMMGFRTAINSGYDRVVYLEMDLLFARPLAEAFAMMTKPAACLPLIGHGKFPETGLFIADCKHMRAIDFVNRYNWRGPCSPEGELRQWQIYGDDLQFLPFKGCRDEGSTKPENLRRDWPNGMDWITHAHPETAMEMLRMNGLDRLVDL